MTEIYPNVKIHGIELSFRVHRSSEDGTKFTSARPAQLPPECFPISLRNELTKVLEGAIHNQYDDCENVTVEFI